MSFKTTPFTISISQDRLDELKNSLNAARLPPPFYEGTQPHFGMTTDWLRGALHEWKTSYSWKNLEDRLNTFNHFIADVPYDGSTFQVHYIHHKAPQAPNTIPLLMLHGWPGSFLEFLDVIEPLTAANFDVIVASLPGFTFGQGPPVDKDFGRNQVADIMLSLMLGLGYNEFAVQGGDLGSYVARILATQYSQYCKALHLNMFFVKTPKGLDIASLPLDEQEGIKRGEEWEKTEYGYGQMHGTKPSTTSHVLYSSPLALLAWIAEKFESWTDKTPSLTTILDSVTLWYLTDTFPTSIYFYREFKSWPPPQITIPFGFTWNKHELFPTPRAFLVDRGNLQWFRKHQNCGHFFALERPELFVEDMKDCFADLWPKRNQL